MNAKVRAVGNVAARQQQRHLLHGNGPSCANYQQRTLPAPPTSAMEKTRYYASLPYLICSRVCFILKNVGWYRRRRLRMTRSFKWTILVVFERILKRNQVGRVLQGRRGLGNGLIRGWFHMEKVFDASDAYFIKKIVVIRSRRVVRDRNRSFFLY